MGQGTDTGSCRGSARRTFTTPCTLTSVGAWCRTHFWCLCAALDRSRAPCFLLSSWSPRASPCVLS